MATATLNLHAGGHEVTHEELALIEAPPPTETWFPIKHSTVFDSVRDTLEGAGFEIVNTKLSVSHHDNRFFGTLDLRTEISNGITLAAGIRSSQDKSFPIGFCIGSRVFVCSNLAFHSEIVISKRHTRFGQDRYMESLTTAVANLSTYKATMAKAIERLENWNLSEEEADSIILRSYEQGIIGARQLPDLIDHWRNPEFPEFQPRTGWSLLNAYTACLRGYQESNPSKAALQTIRLQALLKPKELIIDVNSTNYAEAS